MINAPIDIEKEIDNFFIKRLCFKYREDLIAIEAWTRSIAERVEAQTIERCEFYEDGTLHDIKRLYGPKSDKEEGS